MEKLNILNLIDRKKDSIVGVNQIRFEFEIIWRGVVLFGACVDGRGGGGRSRLYKVVRGGRLVWFHEKRCQESKESE